MADNLNLLQQKAREWAQKVVDLHKLSVPENMLARKNALLSTAKTIKDSIESVIGKSSYLEPINQLGFLPIVGAVVITSGIAAIVKWTTDYNKFKTEVEQQNKLIDSGMSPQQAANIVKGNIDKFSYTTIAKYALPAFVLFGIGYFLMRKRER